MDKGGGSAPQPDARIGEAAGKQAELGQQWLDFAKDAFKVSQGRQEELDALTKQYADKQAQLAQDNSDYTKSMTDRQLALAEGQADYAHKVTDQQLAEASRQSDIAKADRERWETEFRPVEDQFVEEASNYASPERQNEAAAEAMADVQTKAGAAREAAQRQATSMGINPASGRYAGIDRATGLGTALATAGAANAARNTVRDKGLALKGEVASLGRGINAQGLQTGTNAAGLGSSALANETNAAQLGIGTINTGIGNAGSAAGLGLNAANSALGGYFNANGQYIGSTGIMGGGYNGALAGYGNEASTLQGLYGGQLQAYNTQQQANASAWNGIGSAIGLGAGLIFSSKKLKEDKRPLPDGAALEAVNEMPVEAWKYRDGVADGGEHVGTYAEDFQHATGRGDGTTIPVQDAIGITMGAVKDLSRKVDAVASAIGLGGAGPRRRKPVIIEGAARRAA